MARVRFEAPSVTEFRRLIDALQAADTYLEKLYYVDNRKKLVVIDNPPTSVVKFADDNNFIVEEIPISTECSVPIQDR